MSNLQALKYARGSLLVLDQLKIPYESTFIPVVNVQDTWSVIRLMQVRGAPLIAITAALGLAVEAHNRRSDFSNITDAASFLLTSMEYLRTSRPTAVNLFIAMDNLTALVNEISATAGATAVLLLDSFIVAAEKIYSDDILANRTMGMNGAKRILELVNRKKVRVLTICNTGSLATGGYGTALGVVRSLHELGKLEHVYACETRPYNQGARLTAYEIVQDSLPGTLICDSMASALMAVKGVDCVVVGADRIAANGDTANKIGTYQLAIAAKYHNVPFFTAAPTTTLDLTMASGAEIEIEERPASELTTIFNQRIAPEGINAWNPAFDVTPCKLIKGVITEVGVIEAEAGSEDGVIHVAEYLRACAQAKVSAASDLTDKCTRTVTPVPTPTGYSRLDEKGIVEYLLGVPKLAELLNIDPNMSAEDARAAMIINEVGDGNLNFVYLIEGRAGSKIVVKQALPYVRCVGESWPLTLRRAYFEYSALSTERKLTGGDYVPEVYHFDELFALIVMRFVEAPHIILRRALIQNQRISSFASDIGIFMAKTLFGTSALALDGGALRMQVSHWSQNIGLCALTEKVIFTDPYYGCDMNRWTSPQLDAYAEGIRQDRELKLAAAYHKNIFLTNTQALLHADLHTGSVMVKEGSTFVIDPEFAFYGPMGFDVGAILANLFMSYFSKSTGSDHAYSEWILEQAGILHSTFVKTFRELWDAAAAKEDFQGELYRKDIFHGDLLQQAQDNYLASVWRDSLGFAGMKMIRRVVGISHVEDLESISDANLRALCEKRVLLFARSLVVGSYANWGLPDVESVAVLARKVYASQPAEAWSF